MKKQAAEMAPYLASFINGVLPTNPKHARKLKKTMKRYFVDGSTLYRKGFNGEPLKCLGEFGIPYKIVTDNGTPFVNKQVGSTLSGYGIKHRRSTPYYPQGNGQAEPQTKLC
ncbi:hypothetical protein L3X38_003432 [Prunus dulcis]|uniref:Integrase catalytic domain-containing protein n=1 Tax=Prunus dulcis TaxID=3755 RepID=A0AAD4ZM25_PRUDU|nr:hypothetical protein L3X38_003432 [Prunus dulcis]